VHLNGYCWLQPLIVMSILHDVDWKPRQQKAFLPPCSVSALQMTELL